MVDGGEPLVAGIWQLALAASGRSAFMRVHLRLAFFFLPKHQLRSEIDDLLSLAAARASENRYSRITIS